MTTEIWTPIEDLCESVIMCIKIQNEATHQTHQAAKSTTVRAPGSTPTELGLDEKLHNCHCSAIHCVLLAT